MDQYNLPDGLNMYFKWLDEYTNNNPYITNSPMWFKANSDINIKDKEKVEAIKNLYEYINIYATDNQIKQYQTSNGKYYYLKVEDAYYMIGQGYTYNKDIMIFLNKVNHSNNYIDYKEVFKGGLAFEKVYVKK